MSLCPACQNKARPTPCPVCNSKEKVKIMSPEEMFDPIVHSPPHYKSKSGLEAIDVIEAFASGNYLRGNALKYLLRAGRKADCIQDLQKAVWYIEREIANQRQLEDEIEKLANRAPPVCPDVDGDIWCKPI